MLPLVREGWNWVLDGRNVLSFVSDLGKDDFWGDSLRSVVLPLRVVEAWFDWQDTLILKTAILRFCDSVTNALHQMIGTDKPRCLSP